jgi:hypothetical protein
MIAPQLSMHVSTHSSAVRAEVSPAAAVDQDGNRMRSLALWYEHIDYLGCRLPIADLGNRRWTGQCGETLQLGSPASSGLARTSIAAIEVRRRNMSASPRPRSAPIVRVSPLAIGNQHSRLCEKDHSDRRCPNAGGRQKAAANVALANFDHRTLRLPEDLTGQGAAVEATRASFRHNNRAGDLQHAVARRDFELCRSGQSWDQSA